MLNTKLNVVFCQNLKLIFNRQLVVKYKKRNEENRCALF